MKVRSVEVLPVARPREVALTGPARLRHIVRVSAAILDAPLHEVLGAERRRELVLARQAAMLVACEAGYSLERVGRILNRDRTTVYWGCRSAARRMSQDTEYAAAIAHLRSVVDQPERKHHHG